MKHLKIISAHRIETFAEVKCDIDPKLLEQSEEQSYTIIHCTYTTSPKYNCNWWVNIYPTTYLVDRYSGEKLEMIHAIGIPLPPQKRHLQRRGDKVIFTLIFPKIPKEWSIFSLIESANNGEGLMGLNISRNDSGIYRIRIS